MKITIWGCRGSLPSPGPDTVGYGGNTPCIGIEAQGQLIVLDAGSGIRRLGNQDLSAYSRIDILLSHLHMDHIQGLGFFQPLFEKEREIHIWGSPGVSDGLRVRLNRYLSPPLFPVRLRDLPCELHLHEIARHTFQIGPFEIFSDYVIHPSPTLGFRVSEGDVSFCYLPDHEPALGWPEFPGPEEWTSGYDLAREVDLLIHDAQYTPEEYRSRNGWGHSSIEHALAFARQAGAKKLLLFHHDPSHSDQTLEKLFSEYVDEGNYPFAVSHAREGGVYVLEG
jgi:phosphoribosyl 1,2-cyclic phosphodiesterase